MRILLIFLILTGCAEDYWSGEKIPYNISGEYFYVGNGNCVEDALYCANVAIFEGFKVRVIYASFGETAHVQTQAFINEFWEWLIRDCDDVSVGPKDSWFKGAEEIQTLAWLRSWRLPENAGIYNE